MCVEFAFGFFYISSLYAAVPWQINDPLGGQRGRGCEGGGGRGLFYVHISVMICSTHDRGAE